MLYNLMMLGSWNKCIEKAILSRKYLIWLLFQPIGLYNGKYEWAARAGSGDCSLNLMAIDIKFDDGLWECQVTASSFESQDALASKPARLVVRGKAILDPDTVQYYNFRL